MPTNLGPRPNADELRTILTSGRRALLNTRKRYQAPQLADRVGEHQDRHRGRRAAPSASVRAIDRARVIGTPKRGEYGFAQASPTDSEVVSMSTRAQTRIAPLTPTGARQRQRASGRQGRARARYFSSARDILSGWPEHGSMIESFRNKPEEVIPGPFGTVS